MKTKIFFLISIIFSLFLSSCSKTHITPILAKTSMPAPTNTQISIPSSDGGLLNYSSCDTPCFMGIEPGITNRTQAVEFLQKTELNRYCNYAMLDKISCASGFVDILFDPNNLVTEVYFQPPKSVTVGAVVEKHGPPDLVVIWEEADSSPEDVNTAMYLCFDKLRACLRLSKIDGLNFSISEDRGIEWGVYYSKLGYDLERENIIADFENSVLEWKGFVRY